MRRGDLINAVENAGYGVLDLSNADVPEDAERADRQAEIDRQRRMVLTGALFTIPLFLLSMGRDLYMTSFMGTDMGGMILSGSMAGPTPALDWLLWSGFPFVFFLLATPVQLIVGGKYTVGAWKAARNNGVANMDTLISLSSWAAYHYSIIVLACIVLNLSGIGAHVYCETTAVSLTRITIRKMLEKRAKGRNSKVNKK